MPPVNHLYIHYPFCKKKCAYCDFISFEKHEDFVTAYHDALCNEIKAFAQEQEKKNEIKTVFFGGGTPSLYPLPLMKNLFKVLANNFTIIGKEITIEVNPGDATQEHLATWNELGINRLSIGVQILDKQILHAINRHQTNESVKTLLSLAPTYFDNISVDLILGLPGTTTQIWFDTLNFIIANPTITHFSIYFLTIYEKTPLYFKVKSGQITLPDENWLIEMYKQTVDFLEKHGFFQYEISNFAKPGFTSIHNKAYWDRKPYKGFGLSAASFDGKKRLVNSNNLVEYLSQTGFFTEELTPRDVLLEELMLGLRQRSGVDLQRVVYLLGEEEYQLFEKNMKQLQQAGLIQKKNGRVFLTARGTVLENRVIVSLIS